MSTPKQEMSFSSYPEGARVVVNGREVCATTPCTVKIDRQQGSAVVAVHKEGYASVTRTVGNSMNPWFFGNIIFGGFLGSTTDFATGAAHQYSESGIHVELRKN